MHTGNLSATAPRCDLDTEAFAQASMLRTERDPMDRENRESMEEIRLRILRITDDLRVIQRELNCAAMQAPTDPELMEALADPPEMESIQTLKSALDQMRHFLCFYMPLVTIDSALGEKFQIGRASCRERV